MVIAPTWKQCFLQKALECNKVQGRFNISYLGDAKWPWSCSSTIRIHHCWLLEKDYFSVDPNPNADCHFIPAHSISAFTLWFFFAYWSRSAKYWAWQFFQSHRNGAEADDHFGSCNIFKSRQKLQMSHFFLTNPSFFCTRDFTIF